LLRHRRRDRHHGEKDNYQNSHAVSGRKELDQHYKGVFVIALGKASCEVYNFAGSGQSHYDFREFVRA